MKRITAGTVLGLLLSSACPMSVPALTNIPGQTISANTTWGPTGSPADTEYLLTGDVIVQGVGIPVLVIQPGTTVRFGSGKMLQIGGTNPGSLIANGTSVSRIKFVGDTSTPGFWDGLKFMANSDDGTSSSLSYCDVWYGGGTGTGALIQCLSTTTPTVTNCDLRYSSTLGLLLDGTSSIAISGTSFSNITRYPASVPVAEVASVVNGNTFAAKSTYNAILIQGGTITASSTWPVPPAGHTYMIETGGQLRVQGGAVLTLQAGTIIKHFGTSFWKVGEASAGALNATGVTFTSARDDTVGDATGDGSTAAGANDWGSIEFLDKSVDASSSLASCLIRFGGVRNVQSHGAVSLDNAYPAINGCTFESNEWSLGIIAEQPGVSVTNCKFRRHITAVVRLHPGAVEAVLKNSANNTFSANPSGKHNVVMIDGQNVTLSTSWPVPAAGFTYLVKDGTSVYVDGPGSPTLTLLPGTVIKLSGTSNVVVGEGAPGALVADDVVFTSALDDAAGGDATGNGASSGGPGDWTRIRFANQTVAGVTQLTNCEFRFGGRGGQPMVMVEAAPVSFHRCVFDRSATSGLYLDGTAASPAVVDHCAFYGNQYGLRTVNGGNVLWRVDATCFDGNSLYGVYVDPTANGFAKISAQGCWWGDVTGPGGVGPGTGDAVSANVIYSDWAATTVCDLPTAVRDGAAPPEIRMHAAYPNPFNPTVSIPFEISDRVAVRIEVFNLEGRRVATLVDEPVAAGRHEVRWSATNGSGNPVASGVYFCRFQAGTYRSIQKIVLLK